MRDVLVDGTFVIRGGVLDPDAYPGRAVRRPVTTQWPMVVASRARE
jgi:hypothetical protein